MLYLFPNRSNANAIACGGATKTSALKVRACGRRDDSLPAGLRPEGPPFNSHDRKVVEATHRRIREARRADRASLILFMRCSPTFRSWLLNGGPSGLTHSLFVTHQGRLVTKHFGLFQLGLSVDVKVGSFLSGEPSALRLCYPRGYGAPIPWCLVSAKLFHRQ